MEFKLDNDEGEDFATVVFDTSRDDDFTVVKMRSGVEIRMPLFSHEARQLIEVLSLLAARHEYA